MEQIVKMVASFSIKATDFQNLKLDIWELTALQLWLLMAINTEDPRPLWLKNKVFARSHESAISFDDGFEKVTRAGVVEIINEISYLTEYEDSQPHMLAVEYPQSNSWHAQQNPVDVNETEDGSFIGWWCSESGDSMLPVKLRWSGDMGVWYAIKGETGHGITFQFKELSLGQI